MSQRLDEGAEEFIIKQQSLKLSELPLMTPNGLYYYQVIEDEMVALIPKDHPLMSMTDDEFIASFDETFYDELAEKTYQEALAVCLRAKNG
jgi:hypothetical protein